MIRNLKKIGFFFGLMCIVIIVLNSCTVPFHAEENLRQYQPELLIGDILFMDLKAGIGADQYMFADFPEQNITSNDHCALYVGENMFIEASPSGVNYTSLEEYYPLCENFTIARVKNIDQTQREAAVNWAIGRIGCAYQHWFPIPNVLKCADDVTSQKGSKNKFYCSEFVWAAYYNTSHGTIDIDANGWGRRPWFLPSVNMGVPQFAYRWIFHVFPFKLYLYQNEIQIDDDIELLPWT